MRNTPQFPVKFKTWHDYLAVRVPEHYRRPFLFFPVYFDPSRLEFVCVFFLLAPFVIIARLLAGMFWQGWYDLLRVIDAINRCR